MILPGHTADYRQGSENTDIRGTYLTLEDANAAARIDLLNEWNLDFFKSHEVTTDDYGTIDVAATCPRGEMLHVFIEKKKAPPQPISNPPTSKPVPEATR